MQLRIAAVEDVQDVQGKFGPQKRIRIRDEAGRSLSGFVNAQIYNAKPWATGTVIEAEVTQNGSWWNFKILSQKAAAEKKNDDAVLVALRLIYTKLEKIEAQLAGKEDPAEVQKKKQKAEIEAYEKRLAVEKAELEELKRQQAMYIPPTDTPPFPEESKSFGEMDGDDLPF